MKNMMNTSTIIYIIMFRIRGILMLSPNICLRQGFVNFTTDFFQKKYYVQNTIFILFVTFFMISSTTDVDLVSVLDDLCFFLTT